MKSRPRSCLAPFIGVVCVVALLAVLTLPIWMTMDVRSGEDFWYYQVPAAATGIYARGTYADFSIEFNISESDLLTHAQGQGWELEEITEPIRIKTYLAYDDTSPVDDYVTVTTGLGYDCWWKTGEGF